MVSSFGEATIGYEECPPLSVCERWRLGCALLVASAAIEVVQRLPRRSHLEFDHRAVSFPRDEGARLVLVDSRMVY
jgi:hypothetical protein